MTVANCHRGVAFRQETHAFKMRIVAGTNVPTPLVNLNTPLPAARHSNGGSEKLEEGRQSEQNTSICSGCPVRSPRHRGKRIRMGTKIDHLGAVSIVRRGRPASKRSLAKTTSSNSA